VSVISAKEVGFSVDKTQLISRTMTDVFGGVTCDRSEPKFDKLLKYIVHYCQNSQLSQDETFSMSERNLNVHVIKVRGSTEIEVWIPQSYMKIKPIRRPIQDECIMYCESEKD